MLLCSLRSLWLKMVGLCALSHMPFAITASRDAMSHGSHMSYRSHTKTARKSQWIAYEYIS